MNAGTRRSGLRSQLRHLEATSPLASHLTSLCFSFLICQLVIMKYLHQKFLLRINELIRSKHLKQRLAHIKKGYVKSLLFLSDAMHCARGLHRVISFCLSCHLSKLLYLCGKGGLREERLKIKDAVCWWE